jgi:hypothetical protein
MGDSKKKRSRKLDVEAHPDRTRNKRLHDATTSDSGGTSGGGYYSLPGCTDSVRKRRLHAKGLTDIAEFAAGTRSDAHALGAALEAARAEEKRAAEGGDPEQLSFAELPLLRRAEQDLGPPSVLDVLVPSLRTLNQRVVVLEDKDKRLDIFKCWFTHYDLACTKTIREGVNLLLEKQADFLFLDFDIHDPGDRTLREWLRVSSERKELDGLDLAYYVAKRIPIEKRPKNIIIHSRNPMGRRLMQEYLARRGVTSTLWAFHYEWEGPDATAPRPVLPPKPSPKTLKTLVEKTYSKTSWLEAYDDAKGWSGL